MASLLAYLGCLSQKSSGSDPRITNGQLDLGDQSVFLIQSISPGTHEKHTCTSVLIRPELVLTAAHCVQERDTRILRQVQLALPSAPGIKKIQVHPRYESKSRFDIALLHLDRPIRDKKPVALAKALPKKGDQVRLVGFGDNEIGLVPEESGGGGVKRTGYASVTTVDDHYIYLRGIRTAKPPSSSHPTGVDSSAAHGDSGGPLLNLNGELLGIACAINASSRAEKLDPERPIISAYTQVEAVRDFIESRSP